MKTNDEMSDEMNDEMDDEMSDVLSIFAKDTIDKNNIANAKNTNGTNKEKSSLLENYEYRPQQKEMAQQVWKSLDAKEICFIEAGTGIGKTLAYLLPLLHFAAKENVRVAISTETKSLQQQILNKDLPIAEEVLARPIKAELCLCAANYVCKRRLQNTLNLGKQELTTISNEELEDFLDWEKDSTGLRQEYDNNLPNQFWNKINRDPLDCLASHCPNYNISPYFVARRSWQKAELLILNHSILSNHFANNGKLLPKFDYLVIDEAHRFPGILQNAFTLSASVQELRSLLKEDKLQNLKDEKDFKKIEIVKEVESFYKELQKQFLAPNQNQYKTQQWIRSELALEEAYKILNALEQLQKNLEKQLKLMSSQGKLKIDTDGEVDLEHSTAELQLQSRISRLEKFQELIEKLAAIKDKDEVVWIEKRFTSGETKRLRDIVIYCASLSGGRFLQEEIFPQISSVLLTSATLNTDPNNKFNYILKELGFDLRDAPLCLKLDSPFSYQKQTLLYLPDKISDPGKEQENFHKDIAKEIHRLVKLSQGGAFVLFTSANALKKCQALLEHYQENEQTKKDDNYDYKIYSQASLGASLALSSFQKAKKKNGVLLGLATFWQGVDIPGDRLRLVIITRIPFRVPDEPILAARWEAEVEAGNKAFHELQMPTAIISMRQGFGRLIRSFKDKGIIAILDPRLQSRSYGPEILKVLPPSTKHSNFKDLEQAYLNLLKD